MVPFTVTNTPIEPIWVMASGSGPNVPNWDIRDEFPNEGTMLVVNDATGRSLAKTLGAARVCLLRGHGAVIATSELKDFRRRSAHSVAPLSGALQNQHPVIWASAVHRFALHRARYT